MLSGASAENKGAKSSEGGCQPRGLGAPGAGGAARAGGPFRWCEGRGRGPGQPENYARRERSERQKGSREIKTRRRQRRLQAAKAKINHVIKNGERARPEVGGLGFGGSHRGAGRGGRASGGRDSRASGGQIAAIPARLGSSAGASPRPVPESPGPRLGLAHFYEIPVQGCSPPQRCHGSA